MGRAMQNLTVTVASEHDTVGWDFVARIVEAVAWPIAAILIAWWFRGHIAKLLGSLKALSYGDARAEFGEELSEAEGKIEEVPLPPSVTPTTQVVQPQGNTENALFPQFETLAQVSPNAAVLDIWSDVYSRVKAVASLHGIEARNATGILSALSMKGTLERVVISLLNDLRQMRNVAAHSDKGKELTLSDAIRYRDIAQVVVPFLERAITKHGKGS